MKTTIKLLVVLALTLTTFLQHSTASAGEVFKFKGRGVDAFFTSTQGCVVADVFLSATESTTHNPPGPGEEASIVHVLITQYDACTDTELLAATDTVQVSAGDLQISGKLETAILNTTVNVVDLLTGRRFDVFIDMTWTAAGPLVRESSKFRSHTRLCKIHTHLKGLTREAEASGTISDGITNFTPEPAFRATIFSSKSGEFAVGCGF